MATFRLITIEQPDRIGDALEIMADDLVGAQKIAIAGIRDILSHELVNGEIDLRRKMEIRDSTGILLLTISYAETFNTIL
ncbi:MAG: hypothetical protein EOO77_13950 [Oxalobacteraceae bacterium]|nr:MAG: hypothetical protein EOO77_13950 [Oxalobacteraceae bacterium]